MAEALIEELHFRIGQAVEIVEPHGGGIRVLGRDTDGTPACVRRHTGQTLPNHLPQDVQLGIVVG